MLEGGNASGDGKSGVRRIKSSLDVRRDVLPSNVKRTNSSPDVKSLLEDSIWVKRSCGCYDKLYAGSELDKREDGTYGTYIVMSDLISDTLAKLASLDKVEDDELLVQHASKDFAIPVRNNEVDDRLSVCTDATLDKKHCDVGVLVVCSPENETSVSCVMTEDGKFTDHVIDYTMRAVGGVVLFCERQEDGTVVIDRNSVRTFVQMLNNLKTLSMKSTRNATGLYLDNEIYFGSIGLKTLMCFKHGNERVLVECDCVDVYNHCMTSFQGKESSSTHEEYFVQTLQKHVNEQLHKAHKRGERLTSISMGGVFHDVVQYVRSQSVETSDSEKVESHEWSDSEKVWGTGWPDFEVLDTVQQDPGEVWIPEWPDHKSGVEQLKCDYSSQQCGRHINKLKFCIGLLSCVTACIGVYGLVCGFEFSDNKVINSKSNIGFACAMIGLGVIACIAVCVQHIRSKRLSNAVEVTEVVRDVMHKQ